MTRMRGSLYQRMFCVRLIVGEEIITLLPDYFIFGARTATVALHYKQILRARNIFFDTQK